LLAQWSLLQQEMQSQFRTGSRILFGVAIVPDIENHRMNSVRFSFTTRV
jgi:hypothetical protein